MRSAEAHVWDDSRVKGGLPGLQELRARTIAAGATQIGWKIGFGSAALMESLGTTGALVGFLTSASVVTDGDEVSIGGWTAPRLEPELAVRLGSDVSVGADRAVLQASIEALAPAIELVDLDLPPSDLPGVVAGNIFHRHVVLGEFVTGASLPERVEVRRNGELRAVAEDPAALPGETIALIGHVADSLHARGEQLRAGEIIITGSTTPLLEIAAGEDYEVTIPGLGNVTTKLRN
ncbi:MAG TPA: fumarylacetoacetate hydrolase family protein [Baekduia sp.]|nr:fumarylacetoacetate hydrolase family protein [Baekduia sp.]